jgi:hypothetical protein
MGSLGLGRGIGRLVLPAMLVLLSLDLSSATRANATGRRLDSANALVNLGDAGT